MHYYVYLKMNSLYKFSLYLLYVYINVYRTINNFTFAHVSLDNVL